MYYYGQKYLQIADMLQIWLNDTRTRERIHVERKYNSIDNVYETWSNSHRFSLYSLGVIPWYMYNIL